jgi:hypothetical protein
MQHEKEDQQAAGKSYCEPEYVYDYIGLVAENVPDGCFKKIGKHMAGLGLHVRRFSSKWVTRTNKKIN